MLRTEQPIRWLVLLGALIVGLYLVIPPGDTTNTVLTNIVFTIVSAGAGLLCLQTARTTAGRAGRAWRYFGAGCLAWCAGQLVWNWYTLVLWDPVPYPSLADVGYVLIYPLMLIGVVLLIQTLIRELPATEIALDSLIIISAASLIAHELVISPREQADSISTAVLIVTLIWEVSSLGLVLVTGLAIAVRSEMLVRGPLGMLLAGFVLLSVSNAFYGDTAVEDGYTVGTIVDLGWQLGFICIGIAALVARQQDDAKAWLVHHSRYRRATIARTALMIASVLIVSGVSAFAASRPTASTTVIVLVILSGSLLAARLGYAGLIASRLARRTHERDRLAGVVAASNAISSTLDLEQILPRLATAAAETVGRARAEVYVFDEAMTTVEMSAASGFTDDETAKLAALVEPPVGAFPAERRVIETLAPVMQWSDDPATPPAYSQLFMDLGKYYTLVTPLVAHGRVVGVFDTWTPHDTTPFEQEDIDAAAAVGQQAGLAIHNARLLARTQQNAADQAALLRVSHATVSSLELDAVLAEIAQASLGVANAEACSIEICAPEGDATILAAEATIPDWPGTSEIGTRISFEDWPINWRVLDQRETLNMLATDDILTEREQRHFARDNTQSILMVPLLINDEAIGALNLFSRNARRFTADEVRLAHELATQIAIAIDRARLHEALRERADTDGLTNVLNHRAILETLDTELARVRRSGPPLSILMIDLDGFKQVNDQFGHQSGDEVLRQTAEFLRASVRDIDHVGRYGGDEFLLLLPNTDADGARQFASRLLDGAEDAVTSVNGQRLPIQLSAGIATTSTDGTTRQALLTVADARMYESKAARRWINTGDHHFSAN